MYKKRKYKTVVSIVILNLSGGVLFYFDFQFSLLARRRRPFFSSKPHSLSVFSFLLCSVLRCVISSTLLFNFSQTNTVFCVGTLFKCPIQIHIVSHVLIHWYIYFGIEKIGI